MHKEIPTRQIPRILRGIYWWVVLDSNQQPAD
jgi:hypothetical protein